MVPSSRRGKSLSSVLRDRDWRILKKYLPPTLFMETNLPSIRVIDPRTNRITNEDAPLALSVYLPGKVMFRVGGKYGALIPFKKKSGVSAYFTLIKPYYGVNFVNVHTMNMPEEYVYFIDKKFGHTDISVYELDEIRPRQFYARANSGSSRCYHWFSWYDGSMYSFLETPRYAARIRSIIVNAFNKRKSFSYRVVLKTSNSFGRTIYWYEGYKKRRSEFNKQYGFYERVLKKILGWLGAADVGLYDAERMYKVLYAIDFRQIRDRLVLTDNKNIRNAVRIINNIEKICKDNNGRYIVQGLTYINRDVIEGVRLLGIEDQGQLVPVIVGYRIRDTTILQTDFEETYINDFIEGVLKSTNEKLPEYKELEKLNDLKNIYTILTVNQVLTNILKFFLANDLFITTMAMENKIKLEPLTNILITYNDLYEDEKTADIIHSYSCNDIVAMILEKMYNLIKNLIEDKNRDNRVLIVKYFLYGKRKISPSNIKQDELKKAIQDMIQRIKERLEDLLCNEEKWLICKEWRCNALWTVLLHTYNHHMISTLSKRSHIPVSYLSEIYDLSRENSFVFESVSGGIGAIETSVKNWVKHRSEAFEDLVLKFGSCLLGQSEDLIYFGTASTPLKDLVKLSPQEIIDNTINKLGIVCLPMEREESIKLISALRGEVERLSSLISISTDPWDLFKEVIKARYECEKEFKRFCTTDEITLYIFKNLKSYQLIKELFKAITARLIEAKSERLKRLAQIYGISNVDKLSEKVLDDLHSLVDKGSSGNPGLDLEKDEDIIVDLARAMKSALIKLYLKSCDGACGLCYLNTHSCRFGAPWIQNRTINRRLAKLFVTYAVNKLSKDHADIDELLGKLIGNIRLGGNKKYLILD